jgi:hypothetical protein
LPDTPGPGMALLSHAEGRSVERALQNAGLSAALVRSFRLRRCM